MIYLDYQATTPVAPEVAEAMRPWAEEWFANPHSPSRWGREADAAIDHARREVEELIGLGGGSVAFTGSATEAINWALKGSVEKWTRTLVRETRKAMSIVLPFEKNELQFLERLNGAGEIEAELLTSDGRLRAIIQSHPGLLWKAQNVKKHRAGGSGPPME